MVASMCVLRKLARMIKHVAVAVGILMSVGCGSAEQDDASYTSDELIDNGDGTVAIPESWMQNAVEIGDSPEPPTSEDIEKAVLAAADVRSGVGPTLFSNNFTYTLTLPYPAGRSFGPITSIPYTWSLGYIPAGLVVTLCRNTTATCAIVTGAQSGTVHTFDTQQSNVPFIFTFRVNAASPPNPSVQGQNDQVIINHN